MPGQPLRIAVAEAEHVGATERIVRRRRAVLLQPQDLAAQRSRVRRDLWIAGVARRRVQLAIGTESETPAAVVAGRRDAVQQDLVLHARAALVTHAHDAVRPAARRRVVDVHETVGREIRIERQA